MHARLQIVTEDTRFLYLELLSQANLSKKYQRSFFYRSDAVKLEICRRPGSQPFLQTQLLLVFIALPDE